MLTQHSNNSAAHLKKKDFLNNREELIKNGYHLLGLFIDGEIASVAGFIFYPSLYNLKDIWITDLVTLEKFRSQGLGKAFLKHIEEYAKSEGCSRVCLHTNHSREDAKRFYEKHAEYENYASVFKCQFN